MLSGTGNFRNTLRCLRLELEELSRDAVSPNWSRSFWQARHFTPLRRVTPSMRYSRLAGPDLFIHPDTLSVTVL